MDKVIYILFFLRLYLYLIYFLKLFFEKYIRVVKDNKELLGKDRGEDRRIRK